MTALDLLHGLVLDDGRRWGAVAVDWQREDARAVLEPAEDEPTLHWLGRPKGGSKTTDLAGMSIAWLIEQAPDMGEGYACAADREQSNRLLDAARRFIGRSPELGEVLEVQSARILNRRNGARVHALEADSSSVEGLLSPWIVLDELPNWPATRSAKMIWTALSSAILKWPRMRFVVIGHAGDPAHWSKPLLDSTGPAGWHVHEVAGPLPWVSDADLEMQRVLLLPSEFERRHLNRWASSEDRLTSRSDVEQCVRETGVLEAVAGKRYVVTLDVGLTNDRTVVTVAHGERDGDRVRVVVDRQAVWTGSKASPVRLDEVEAFIVEASRGYNDAPLVFDPFQAAHLTQRLRRAGVRVVEFTFSQQSVGRLCVTLFNLLREHLVELPGDDPELVEELVNARVVERSPGVYRIDHDAGKHDDRVIGLALAAQHLVQRSGSRGRLAMRDAHGRLTNSEDQPRRRGRGVKVRGSQPVSSDPTLVRYLEGNG